MLNRHRSRAKPEDLCIGDHHTTRPWPRGRTNPISRSDPSAGVMDIDRLSVHRSCGANAPLTGAYLTRIPQPGSLPLTQASDLSDLSDPSDLSDRHPPKKSTRQGAIQLAPVSEGANAPERPAGNERSHTNRPLWSHKPIQVRPQGSNNIDHHLSRWSSALRASTRG